MYIHIWIIGFFFVLPYSEECGCSTAFSHSVSRKKITIVIRSFTPTCLPVISKLFWWRTTGYARHSTHSINMWKPNGLVWWLQVDNILPKFVFHKLIISYNLPENLLQNLLKRSCDGSTDFWFYPRRNLVLHFIFYPGRKEVTTDPLACLIFFAYGLLRFF